MEFKFPVYRPQLIGNESRYVNECLDSTWISSKGIFLKRFEDEFAQYISARKATAVCNGTVALHLAMLALGISPGDEVIVPTLTYVAPVNAVSYCGATPVFVDSLTDTWQIDPADVRKKISKKTKAILAVHLYGHPCDLEELRKVADENDLFLIEDCAEAIGSLVNGKHVGTVGDVSTFSFFGNKTITTGEGGLVATNDETLYERATHFKGQGLAKHRQYWHDVIGYNYRMTNVCAAIGLAQLEQIDVLLNRKLEIARLYQKYFESAKIKYHHQVGNVRHSYWMFSILLDSPALRDPMREHLASHGIETRPLFYPVHTMPMYSSKYQKHPVAESLGWRGINLPSYPGLTDEDVCYIAERVLDFKF